MHEESDIASGNEVSEVEIGGEDDSDEGDGILGCGP